MYLAFLGLVVLLLVSVFIAQANGCYKNVKDIADQMANYSRARLLTQTSTMLPVWLFNAIAVNILICDSVHCTINMYLYIYIYIDDYYIIITVVISLALISSTFLPQQKKCPCYKSSPYVWSSDWPCHCSCCTTAARFLQIIWQIISSV